MKFTDYYKSRSPEEKRDLARRLGTSVAYLSQIASGHRKAGPRMLMSVSDATDGSVTPQELRPDLMSSV